MPMNRSHLDALGRTLAVTLSLTLALGCSLYKAKRAYDEGRYEDAAQAYGRALLAVLREVAPGDPDD